jgi:flagellar biosynthesis protein FlhG
MDPQPLRSDSTAPAISHQAASLLTQKAAVPQPRRRAPWITVAGGKGGVGKTLLSVNTALLAAMQGRRVLLVDFDPGLANIAVHLRLAPRYDLADLVQGNCSPSEAVVDGPAGMQVLCGRSGDPSLAGGGEHDAGPTVRRALAAIEAAANACRADLVLVDTGAGIGPSVIQAAARSVATLCVTTPDPAALTDAYALIKVLRNERPGIRPALVLNRVRSRDEAMSLAGRMQQVTERFLGFRPDLAGFVRDDSAFLASVMDQRPAALGTGQVVRDLEALVATTLSLLPSRRTDPAVGTAATPRRVRVQSA